MVYLQGQRQDPVFPVDQAGNPAVYPLDEKKLQGDQRDGIRSFNLFPSTPVRLCTVRISREFSKQRERLPKVTYLSRV